MENNDILKYVFQHLQSSNENLAIFSQSFKRYRRVLFVKRDYDLRQLNNPRSPDGPA